MKTVENKTTEIKVSEEESLTYADLLKICIDKPLREGITLDEMRRDLKILGVIKDAKDVLEFEDDDFKVVKEAVATSKWAVRHADLLDFASYIESL